MLALVMVLASGTTAFADTTTTTETENLLTSGSVTIPKDIVVYNTDGKTIYEPNITYTYSVTPVETTASVTDAAGNKANVKKGIDGGLLIKAELKADGTTNDAAAATSASLIFGQKTGETGNITTSAEGTAVASAAKVTRNLIASFDTTKFKDSDNNLLPGIYRYKLSETSTEYSTSGVTKGEYSDDRYIDVYVKWDSTGNALEVYGVTMFTADNTIVGKDATTDAQFKVTGYDVATEADKVDTYHTYNITVKKIVDGSLASKTHEFPFAITINESTATAVQFYTDNTSTDYVNTSLAFSSGKLEVNSSLAASGTGAVTLKHNDQIVFVGLPMTATATVKEKDTTVDVYTATATANTSEGEAKDITLTNDATAKTWTTADNAITSAKGTEKASNTIIVKNTLTEVSPTGVVLRVAPYALMLGAGIVLFLLSRRRKAQVED